MTSRRAQSSHGGDLTPRNSGADLTGIGLAGIPHPQPFVCDITVGRDQLSRSIDHVSNIEYVRWLDRAAELHADSLGFSRQRLIEQGMMWFVARHEIDYLAEAWLGDRLVIATWVRDIRKVKSWRDYVIGRAADGAPICRASTLWVLVDLESRKPIRIGPAMVELFRPLSWLRENSAPAR
jgi:acyl-CoA thioester hydrolase